MVFVHGIDLYRDVDADVDYMPGILNTVWIYVGNSMKGLGIHRVQCTGIGYTSVIVHAFALYTR